METNQIQLVKARDLSQEEKSSIMDVLEEHKVKLLLNNLDNFILQVKKHGKINETKRINYSLHARTENSELKLEAKSDDWDLRKALHELFDNLKNEYEHKQKGKGFKKFMRKYFGKWR